MLVNRLFNGHETGGYAPWGVDIREDADHFYVDAELPGFRKEDVEITLENSTLTVSAERKFEQKTDNNDGGNYLLNERRYTRFLRSFTLPPTIDEKSVQASLKDGVLTISLNKREEVKPRKINVS
jgi:HSP20 family protein